MTLARVMSAVPVVLSIVALTGCSTSEPAGVSASSASTPLSTTVAATSDPAQDAEVEAVAAVAPYFQTIDELYADPTRPLGDIDSVAVVPEATSEASAIQAFRAQGYSRVGSSVVVSAVAGPVDLTNDPTATTPVFPSVMVTVCLDVSGVGAVDSSGAPVGAPDRPEFLISELTVVNIDYPDSASWRVSDAPNRQATSCAG